MAILKFWSTPKLLLGPSWLYGSWIYTHQCNQCLSQQTLESRSGEVSVLDTTLHLFTGYEGNSTFIVPKVPTIVQGNAEYSSRYKVDNKSAI
jgi:hypothetical protein